MGPHWLALLREGLHAFLLILTGEAGVHQTPLELHTLGQRGFESAIDRLLIQRYRNGRVTGNLRSHGQRFIEQIGQETLPPLGSVYVNIIKSTAILSIIGITELTRQGEVLIVRMPQHLMFIYCVIALLYFAYCYPLLYLSKLAEKRFGALEHR